MSPSKRVNDVTDDATLDTELIHSQGLCTFHGPLTELIHSDRAIPSTEAANDLNKAQFMETLSGRFKPAQTEYYVTAVAFSSNGNLQASAGWDSSITIRDTHTGKKLHILKGHQNRVNVLSFSPDNQVLVSSGQDRKLIFWELSSGRPMRVFHNLQTIVTAIAFSPDGRYMATGERDGNLKLWLPKITVAGYDQHARPCLECDPEVLYTLSYHHAEISVIAFSPDNYTFAVGSQDRTISIWPLKSRIKFFLSKLFKGNKPLQVFYWHLNTVTALGFHPDGDTLASGGEDQVVKLFRLSTGELLRTVRKHKAPIVSVHFTRDNEDLTQEHDSNLVIGSRDGTVSIWNPVSGQCLGSLQSNAYRLAAILIAA
ncbi:MAG: WD40 repeat domain-containing protein, partial [Pseudomonadota bacterium]